MGQMTYGVLFGAKISGAGDDRRCEAANQLYEGALRRLGADIQYVDDGEGYWLVGFWLAVGASGRDGVPYLGTVSTAAIPVIYGERYDAAVDGWGRVAAAAAAVGIKDLGSPGFWIAETEVA